MIILFWILNVVACAILWRMGGSDTYSLTFRRVGIPVTTWLFHSGFTVLNFGWATLGNRWITLLTIPLCILAYGKGYGLPEPFETNPDAGSQMAQFVCMILRYKKHTNGIYIMENKFLTELILRAVIGFLYGFALILYAVVSKNYLLWGVQLAICTIGVPLVALSFTNAVKEELGVGTVSNFLTMFIR